MESGNSEPIEWAKTFLEDRGCVLQGEFVPVKMASWSSVHRINTSVGAIFLKEMTPSFAIEARLLLHLGVVFPEKVPEIVGHNDYLNCFLMFDAGVPLRFCLSKNYQPHLAEAALTTCATIQQGLIGDVDSLLALGVPDWRLVNLPFLYEELLDQRHFLFEDGLTELQLKALKKYSSRVSILCKQLGQYAIPETIEHGDFHDNNCLLYGNELIIADWGEALISHPFFSLLSFLKSTMRNYHIAENNNLRRAYLKSWKSFESPSRILEAVALVEQLNPVKFALSFYNLSQCPGMDESSQYKGTVAKALQQFLDVHLNYG